MTFINIFFLLKFVGYDKNLDTIIKIWLQNFQN